MKSAVKVMACLGLLGLFVADTVMAQQGGGRFRQTAYILSDSLMLNEAKTEKLVAAYDEVRQSVREEMQNSQTDFGSMSDEERREYFDKYQMKTAEQLKVELKDDLSETEQNAIEPLLLRRSFLPDAEVRGLRTTSLSDELRAQIQPWSIALGEKVVVFRFGQSPDDPERQKEQEEYDKAKTDFIAKVNGVLSDELKSEWKEKTAEAEKEIEEIRENMRNFRRN